jgi:hypothetical protein
MEILLFSVDMEKVLQQKLLFWLGGVGVVKSTD